MIVEPKVARTIEAAGVSRRFGHLLAELPINVRSAFTPEQVAALALAFDRHETHHRIDFRVSIPMPMGRAFYVTLLAGPERRSPERLDREGQRRASRWSILLAAVVLMLAGLLAFGVVSALYLVKCFFRINLFEAQSPLHGLFVLFFR